MRKTTTLTVAFLVPLLLVACGGTDAETLSGSSDTPVETSVTSSDETGSRGNDDPVETASTVPGDHSTGGTDTTTIPSGCPAIPATNINSENPIPADAAALLVGLSEQVASACAAHEGWNSRVVARDGEDFMVTADYRADRVNFTIENDIVTAVGVG